NASGEDFGSERLVAAVCRNRERPAQAIADAIFEAVDDFRGGAEQHDDRTVVVLKITGQEQESRSRERTGGRRSNRVR
ncbi:MAG TPA: SpoIIE family protein phosphatase, partial [Vicinamibacterales bacterium]|nr:SpoIIE family protein phosphatase [Vicinamibacterales bacterium]